MLKIKRIYEKPEKSDGFRILVDRLWPRGMSKENATLDLWLKDIAPSPALRQWFSHDPKKWDAFQKKYKEELDANPEALQQLKTILQKEKHVTLLYGAKDKDRNQAVAIKNLLG